MSKAEGKKIGIKFTMPLNTINTGNENAFTVTGQEHQWTDGPNNNGPLVSKTYQVLSVVEHPTETNAILIEMLDSFRSIVGDITVSYNQSLGSLIGQGGPVESFTKTFTPTDLEEGLTATGGAYGAHEYIEANVGGSIEMSYIAKLDVYHPAEHIEASVSGDIKLIHIDDINP